MSCPESAQDEAATEPEASETKRRRRAKAESDQAKPKASQPRSRKKKYTVTKQFMLEHGQADMENIRSLREFSLGDGIHSVEDVALMSDEEVKNVFLKDYFVISSAKETYIIRRTALNSIVADVFVVGKE